MVSPSGSLGQRGRKLRAQVTTLQGAAAARDLEWHPEGPGAGALWPGHALLSRSPRWRGSKTHRHSFLSVHTEYCIVLR